MCVCARMHKLATKTFFTVLQTSICREKTVFPRWDMNSGQLTFKVLVTSISLVKVDKNTIMYSTKKMETAIIVYSTLFSLCFFYDYSIYETLQHSFITT